MDRSAAGRRGMVAVRHLQTGFLAGELDPLLSGRVETDHYSYGLATCENFVCVNEGPLVKRPGFEYICDADPTTSWLGAFRYSITQEYVVEWGEAKARFFTNGVRIETAPNVAYELTTPYTAAHAPRLSSQQSYDRLYIDHASYPPAAISRTSATTFTHASTTLNNGPFSDQNKVEATTVTASAASGSGITVTAASAIFLAGHVGSLFRIEAKDFSTIKAWEAGMAAVVIGEIVRSDGKAYQAASAGTTGGNVPVHTSGSEWDGQGKNDVNAQGPYGVKWTYLHDRFGIVQITAIGGGGTSATCDVLRRLPDQVVSVATHRWAHSAFSAAAGWPSLVVHWGGRQVHFKDFDIVASVVGDYGGGQCNFATFTSSGALAADMSFRRTLAISDPPLWVAGDRKLLVGTASREMAIGAINTALAVAGDNISAEPQSFYGSEPVFPEQLGTATVFVERGARRLRAGDYDFGRDRYVPADLTATARHVTAGGIVQMAQQRVPFSLLYGVRGDGQLVVHANTRLEIKGFARTMLGGAEARAVSAVSVVGADGVTDELWLLVTRGTPAGARREIWKQAPWRELGDAQAEAFFVDGGRRVAASGGQTHFTGFTHLASQAVAVLANGGVVPGITVAADGSFDLPAASVPSSPYVLIAGLAYTARAVTLRPEKAVRSGSLQGLKKRVRKLALRLLETLGIKVGAPGGRLEEVIDRPGSAAMDAPIPLFSGDTQGPVDMAFSKDGQATFVSSDPLPAIVTAAMLTMETDEEDA